MSQSEQYPLPVSGGDCRACTESSAAMAPPRATGGAEAVLPSDQGRHRYILEFQPHPAMRVALIVVIVLILVWICYSDYMKSKKKQGQCTACEGTSYYADGRPDCDASAYEGKYEVDYTVARPYLARRASYLRR
jgi:hypothetical protein